MCRRSLTCKCRTLHIVAGTSHHSKIGQFEGFFLASSPTASLFTTLFLTVTLYIDPFTDALLFEQDFIVTFRAEERFEGQIFTELALMVHSLRNLFSIERGTGDTLRQSADELVSAIFAVFHASNSMPLLRDITLKHF